MLGDSKVSTALPIIAVIYGRRAELSIAKGIEKRVDLNISDHAAIINDRESEGFRFIPLSGEVNTELDAVTF